MEENTMLNMETAVETETQPQESISTDVHSEEAESQTSEEAVSTEEQTSEAEESSQQTYTVKYNGEERELSMDELLSFAQKGMNYDKVNGQLESYKNNPAMKQSLDIIEYYARQNGLPVEEYLQRLNVEREEAENQRYAEANNIPLEQAANVRKMQEEAQRVLNKQKFTDEMIELFGEHPELRPEDITDAVLACRMQYNVPLSIAYRMTVGAEKTEAELSSLRQQLKIREEASTNTGLSTGSVKGVGTEGQPIHNISKMTLDDYEKNSDQIWANLKRRN